MERRYQWDFQELLNPFLVLLLSLPAFLPLKIPVLTPMSAIIGTFLLPGTFLLNLRISTDRGTRLLNRIIASIIFWLILGRVFIYFQWILSVTNIFYSLLPLLVISLIFFQILPNKDQTRQSYSWLGESNWRKAEWKSKLMIWGKKNLNIFLLTTFLFVLALYSAVRIPIVPVDDVWYHMTIINDFADNGILRSYLIYNGKTTTHFLWGVFLQFSQINIISLGKWVGIIQVPLGSLMFYRFSLRVIKNRNIAILTSFIFSVSSLGTFLSLSQLWPTAIVFILALQLLTNFFKHLDNYTPGLHSNSIIAIRSPEFINELKYYAIISIISFAIIDAHISAYLVYIVPLIVTLFFIMTRDKRAISEFILMILNFGFFAVYNPNWISYLIQNSFLTQIFQGFNFPLILTGIAIATFMIRKIVAFTARATYPTTKVLTYQFKPQNSTVKLEKKIFWRVLIPILAFGGPTIYFLLNPTTKGYIQANPIILFIELMVISVIYSIYVLVSNIFREESIQGKTLWVFLISFIGMILTALLIGTVYTFILRLLILWTPIVFAVIGLYLSYKLLRTTPKRKIKSILYPLICLYLVSSISYQMTYREHITTPEDVFIQTIVEFSPGSSNGDSNPDSSNKPFSSVIGSFHFYYCYLFYSRVIYNDLGSYNIDNASLIRVENHFCNSTGDQLSAQRFLEPHNNVFILLDPSYISRGVLLIDGVGYGKMTQEEYDSYGYLEYLNQIGSSTTQQRLYWVR